MLFRGFEGGCSCACASYRWVWLIVLTSRKTCIYSWITSVDAEASLGASLRELAAVVKLQCTAAVHRFLRGGGGMEGGGGEGWREGGGMEGGGRREGGREGGRKREGGCVCDHAQCYLLLLITLSFTSQPEPRVDERRDVLWN